MRVSRNAIELAGPLSCADIDKESEESLGYIAGGIAAGRRLVTSSDMEPLNRSL